MRNVSEFLSENFPILEVKFSIYLNRRVFVMFAFAVFTFTWHELTHRCFVEIFIRLP